jgi:hypothetical protein
LSRITFYAIFGFAAMTQSTNAILMDDDAISAQESEAIRRRLMVIRKYVAGDNQAEFARKLGIASTRWNNMERGFPLTLKVTFLLIKTVDGLTTGYITHGHTERLPAALKRQLASLEEEMFPSKGKRPSRT